MGPMSLGRGAPWPRNRRLTRSPLHLVIVGVGPFPWRVRPTPTMTGLRGLGGSCLGIVGSLLNQDARTCCRESANLIRQRCLDSRRGLQSCWPCSSSLVFDHQESFPRPRSPVTVGVGRTLQGKGPAPTVMGWRGRLASLRSRGHGAPFSCLRPTQIPQAPSISFPEEPRLLFSGLCDLSGLSGLSDLCVEFPGSPVFSLGSWPRSTSREAWS